MLGRYTGALQGPTCACEPDERSLNGVVSPDRVLANPGGINGPHRILFLRPAEIDHAGRSDRRHGLPLLRMPEVDRQRVRSLDLLAEDGVPIDRGRGQAMAPLVRCRAVAGQLLLRGVRQHSVLVRRVRARRDQRGGRQLRRPQLSGADPARAGTFQNAARTAGLHATDFSATHITRSAAIKPSTNPPLDLSFWRAATKEAPREKA